MAKYINAMYEADNGEIHPIRVRPETLTAQIDSQPTATTRSEFFRATPSKRKYGYFARGWNCYRKIAAGTNDDLIKRKFIPCLIANDWKDDSRLVNDKITIGGVEWTIGSHEPERIR
jgi:hypothetical protein